MKHILKAQQFDRTYLERFAAQVDQLKQIFPNPHEHKKLKRALAGRLMCSFFSEESTRTRFSTEVAAVNLGMNRIGTEAGAQFSSEAKGESVEDTTRVLAEYGVDLMVIRHKTVGAAERAAQVCSDIQSPMIVFNAGDGWEEHPTQALLDDYTIVNEVPGHTVDGKTVVFGFDLKYGRTIRSLAYLLSKFAPKKIIFVSPPALQMREDMLRHLEEHEIPYAVESDLLKVIPEADVIYWARPQRERMKDEPPEVRENSFTEYTITAETMKRAKERAILMHPLPNVGEIAREVDNDPRAAYFRQVRNGLYCRMVLLLNAFDVPVESLQSIIG